MLSLNFILGITILILFSLIVILKPPKEFLLPLLLYLIIIAFISRIVIYMEPIHRTNYLHGSKGFILPIAFLATLLKYNKVLNSKLGVYIVIYVVYFAIMALFTPGDIKDNFSEFLGAPMFMGFYFIGLQYFDNDKRIHNFFKFIIVLYIINIMIAYYQQLFDFFSFDKLYLITQRGQIELSDTTDPITGKMYYQLMGFSAFPYSFYYILSMLFIIILSSKEYFIEHKKIIFVYIILYAVLLLLSLERTPIIMLAFLPIALIKNKKKFILYIALLIGVVILINNYHDLLFFFGSERLSRFAEIVTPFQKGTNLNYRYEARWIDIIPVILKNPWGIGAGNEVAIGIHNNYLKIFLQTGWFGGILFLFILLKSMIMCYHNYKKLKNTYYAQLILGILAASIAMFATGIPNIPFGYDCAIFFWLLLGLVEKLPNIYKSGLSSLYEKSIDNSL